MTLQKAIPNWDGKSADFIGDIYKGYAHESTFVNQLIALIEHPPTQKGATWLLKHHFENHAIVTPRQIKALYTLLPLIEVWESKLHMLQCIPFMPITNDEKTIVEAFVRESLTSKNKFVRAWAYNGFHQLASHYPEYQAEASELLERALEEEAPSVKARIRNILKN